MKVVIVGGVAGGATAAARIRRLDEHADIILFEKTGYISYANCGLPYYIGGVIEDSSELTLQTPEGFWNRFRVQIKVHHEVVAIHRDLKCVTVKNLLTGAFFDEPYDKLLLAPGARPNCLNVDGVEDPQIFTLRNVEDTFQIKEYIQKKKPHTAVIIGGGYIGIEMGENLVHAGIQVTIVQNGPQLMNTLDYDMATFVHAKLRECGVRIILNGDVVKFVHDENQVKVLLHSGETLSTDLVLLSIGVSPDTKLAEEADLALGIKKSILVNDKMETSDPSIYAVGDAIQVNHFITQKPASIALAGPANKQGRIAADNICGGDSHYKGSLGSSIIKIFDMTVASTGLTKKAAIMMGFDFDDVILSPSSHAGYYPEAKTMTMKVLFEKKTLNLLGAQIIGYDGVDKRIDVLATAICSGLKADALKDLDLAYAPPYSSAKDPINMAGFIIVNLHCGLLKQFHYEEVDSLPRDGSVTLLDTRTRGEYARGHVNGFINIPVDELRERLHELDTCKPLYVMCQSGLRSYIACRILSQEGFNCYNFSGGYRLYERIHTECKLSDYSYPCGMEQ